jgi:excisionase family DNA binding protein
VAEYLKLQEVARRLDVSEKTARRYVKSGTLPSLFIGGAYRVSEADLQEFLKQARVDPGKAPGRSPAELSLFNGLEEERRLRYLRPWRAFVHGLARRWEKEPPKTSKEIEPLYEALTAVVEQGVFQPPYEVGPSEAHELMLLTIGFQRLNEIADNVEKDEHAEQRRAAFRTIQEQRSA